MRKERHGKYYQYKLKILQFLSHQKSTVSTAQIRRTLKIPRTSCYDVLEELRDVRYIDWIGEFQDAISIIEITPKGRKYLIQITK